MCLVRTIRDCQYKLPAMQDIHTSSETVKLHFSSASIKTSRVNSVPCSSTHTSSWIRELMAGHDCDGTRCQAPTSNQRGDSIMATECYEEGHSSGYQLVQVEDCKDDVVRFLQGKTVLFCMAQDARPDNRKFKTGTWFVE
eukprot:scpid7174/ scgid31449/ 